MPVRVVRRDDKEAVVREFRDRKIRLERARIIEPLRVGDHTWLAIDSVRGHSIEHAPGIAPLHQELRHERHVHEPGALAHRAMLLLPVREPVLSPPRQLLDNRLDARRRVPVGALPATHIAEVGTLLRQPVVHRRTLDAAR